MQGLELVSDDTVGPGCMVIVHEPPAGIVVFAVHADAGVNSTVPAGKLFVITEVMFTPLFDVFIMRVLRAFPLWRTAMDDCVATREPGVGFTGLE